MELQRKRIGDRKWIFCMAAILFVASLSAKPVARGTQLSKSPALYSGSHIEKTWIPMSDGVRLAVTLYLPEGARPGEKFPAILEYIEILQASRETPSRCAIRAVRSLRASKMATSMAR